MFFPLKKTESKTDIIVHITTRIKHDATHKRINKLSVKVWKIVANLKSRK